MALSVIGSGFGRTGTRSLKDALEQLGLAPCHHMEEVFAHPEQVRTWQAVAAGAPVDWAQAFKGYKAQVDWPGSHVWRRLAETFPDAKVVHSVRPDAAWWNSFSQTIGRLMSIYTTMPMPAHVRDMLDAARSFIGEETFHGGWADREKALAAYHRRTEEVRAALPKDRLLVFDVAEGWEPLCRFLAVPVPATPFPHRNVKADFWAVLGGEPPLP